MNVIRGDIFWADMGFKCRPYLVVSTDKRNANANNVIAVPLSGKIQDKLYPTHVPVCYGSITPSIIKCEDLTMIEDVHSKYTAVEHLPDAIMKHVDVALRAALSL